MQFEENINRLTLSWSATILFVFVALNGQNIGRTLSRSMQDKLLYMLIIYFQQAQLKSQSALLVLETEEPNFKSVNVFYLITCNILFSISIDLCNK